MISINLRGFTRFATPLIFSSMAGSMMLFCDRLILARYNLEAMNAATMVGNACALVQFGLIAIVAIAEVFVGQYNGAGQDAKVAAPVWQMVWLSLFSFLFIIPLAAFGAPLALSGVYREVGTSYYQWAMGSSPLMALSVAFSSFFIGQGRAAVVTLVAVGSNLLNCALAILLVFGCQDWIPAYGMVGAGVATTIAESVNVLALLMLFLRKENRDRYQTHKPTWDGQTLVACLKVGAPNAAAHVLEILSWAVCVRIIAAKGASYLTVVSIGQTIFILSSFFTEGLNKAAAALSANCIGARAWNEVAAVLRAAISFHGIVISALAVWLIVCPAYLIHYFIPDPDPILYEQIRLTLVWVWLFILFDGINWIFAGVLTSGGDTWFIMRVSGIAFWALGALPVYLMVRFVPEPATHALWGVSGLYAVVLSFVYSARYASGKWKKLQLT